MGKHRGSGHKKRGGNPEPTNQAKPKGQTPRNKRSKGQRKQSESQGVEERNEQVTDSTMDKSYNNNLDEEGSGEGGRGEAMDTNENATGSRRENQHSAKSYLMQCCNHCELGSDSEPSNVQFFDPSGNQMSPDQFQHDPNVGGAPPQHDEPTSGACAPPINDPSGVQNVPSATGTASISNLDKFDKQSSDPGNDKPRAGNMNIYHPKTEKPVQMAGADVIHQPPSRQEMDRMLQAQQGDGSSQGNQSQHTATGYQHGMHRGQQGDGSLQGNQSQSIASGYQHGMQQAYQGDGSYQGNQSQHTATGDQHGGCSEIERSYEMIERPETHMPPEEIAGQRLMSELQELKQKLEEANSMKMRADEQMAGLRQQLQNTDGEMRRCAEELGNKQTELMRLQEQHKCAPAKQMLQKKVKDLEQNIKEQKQEIKSKNKIIETVTNQRDDKQKGLREFAEKDVQRQIDIANELSRIKAEHEATLKQYQDAWQQKLYECDGLKQSNQDCRTKISKLSHLLHESEEECRSLSLRLSKFAGAQLVYNNPNIADLSDAFRPTKLGEMFSELYDNEWTDSFEELHSNKTLMTEVDTTQYMMQLLKRAYDLCKEITTSHMTSITKSITSVTFPMEVRRPKPEPNAQTSDSIGNGESCKGNDGRDDGSSSANPTETANNPIEAEDNPAKNADNPTKTANNPIETEDNPAKTADNPTETANNPIETEDNPAKTADNPTKTADNATETEDNATETEDNAAETGDNPIETDNNTTKTGDSTTETGHTPTKTGDNTNARSPEDQSNAPDNQTSRDNGAEGDTVPEMDSKAIPEDNKTSRDGAKGDTVPESDSKAISEEQCLISIDENTLSIEQKKQIADLFKFAARELQDEVSEKLTEKIMTEKNLDTTYPNTVIYIQSCVKLCWMMCLHKPPVVIGFTEPKEGTKFEKDKFKEYTKTGKWLDFVVWPPLYLHEGGAMLCKGTAQGRKEHK